MSFNELLTSCLKLINESGFADPFVGVTPSDKLTDLELARAIRLDIAAEEEAINLYQAHADATDNEQAKKVLLSIADEERVHVGELQALLNGMLTDEKDKLRIGGQEVDDIKYPPSKE